MEFPSPSHLGLLFSTLVSWALELQRKIENTQRTFTRHIKRMKELDYAQRLKSLNMFSIQRHERYKVIYAYKIKEGLIPNISQEYGLKFA